MIPIKPKGARWTDAQWTAIYKRGGNILVSAGAGSGKTAVLTKRVVELVDSGVDISTLLVVTFTRAAALEMKTRIRDDLQSLLLKGHEHIASQLELLESANITTFDGYSLFIVKKYSDVLNVSRNLSVGDPVILKQAKNRIVEELFEGFYQDKDEEFFRYLRRYSTKSDTTIKQSILDLGDKLMKDPNFEDYLNHGYLSFFEDEYYQMLMKETQSLIEEQLEYLAYFIKRLKLAFRIDLQAEYVEKIENSLTPLLESNHIDDVYAFVSKYRMPNKPQKVFDEEESLELDTIRNYIKNILKDLKEISSCTMSEYLKDLKDNEIYIKSLVHIVKEYIHRYHDFQKENNLYDYQTIAYLSIQLIQNNPSIQAELRNLYTEIMVDEYQDTNLLQDQFVTMISNDNLYLVGDMKQSIYRFRDATPSLFQHKYELYNESETDTVIHLNKNFRSRSEVLEDINRFFKQTFDKKLGGIDYDELQQLEFGLTPYNTEQVDTDTYGLEVLNYQEEEIEDYDESMSKKSIKRGMVELEAITIAKDILHKVENNYQVYDKETNHLRKATYNDFVILIDRKTNFELFQEKFKECGIPLYIHKENEFISNMDVVVTFNVLKLLQSFKSPYYHNLYFKHSFLSVAFSHLFDYDKSNIISFLARIPSNRPSDIVAYSKGTDFEELFTIMIDIASRMDAMQIDEILLEVMTSFKVIEKTISLGTIQSTEERQLYLLSKATELKSHHYDLEKLIGYFDYIIHQQGKSSLFETTDIEFVKGTSLAENKVNIMTIHKSKGLEFPVVYFPQLHPGWKSSSFDAIQYSKEYGIVIPAFREGLRITLPKILNKFYIQREDLSERIRVFYVALTRARESMIFVTKSTNEEDILKALPSESIIDFSIRRTYKSYHNILSSISNSFLSKTKAIEVDNTFFERTSRNIKEQDLLKPNPQIDGFNYLQNQIESDVVSNETFSLQSLQLLSKEELHAIDLGNEIHHILEGIDFTTLETIDYSIYKGVIKEVLQSFLESSLIQDNMDGLFYQEFEFVSQSNILTQRGVIDLLIEKDNEMIIIDYKLKDISKAHYKKQVKGYAEYISSRTGKKVSAYLYSLLDHVYKQVL